MLRRRKDERRLQTVPLVAILVLIGCCGVAAAAETTTSEVINGRDHISVLAGAAFPSKDYGGTGEGTTLSFIYGRQYSKHWLAELNLQSSIFETGRARGTDFYQNGFTVDAVYSFRDRKAGQFSPFVLLGLGGAYNDFYPRMKGGIETNDDGAVGLAELGVGLVTHELFKNGIRLRVDFRYVYDTQDGGHAEPRAIAGLEIPLGRMQREVRIVEGPVQVREVVREITRPWKDSDNDGIEDERDRCPDTPRGLKVDSLGCVIEDQTIELRGVTFETNQARLTPNAETILEIVSRAFAGQSSLRVEIAGHTDSVGVAEKNQALSQARAETVRGYLISKGARPEQLVARGYGESQLLVQPEVTAADRERNRRVELRVIAQQNR